MAGYGKCNVASQAVLQCDVADCGDAMPTMKSLFSFQGRVGRARWWLTQLAIVAGLLVAFFIAGFVAAIFTPTEPAERSPIVLVAYLIMLPALWVDLATRVKRWHDRDKSGWMVLIGAIPLIGIIWIIVECGFFDGTPGPNRFGESPKGPARAALVFD